MAALLAASVLLVGCTPHTSEQSAHEIPAGLELPGKNPDQWVMPLGQYMLGDTKNSDYAENLLVQPCMEKAGYSWEIPWRDTNGNDGPSWNAVHIRLFNSDLAKKWGYRLAPAADSSLAALAAFGAAHSSLDAAEDKAVTECIFAARETLPTLPGSAQLATSYALNAWLGAQEDEEVVAAATLWKECMQPVGVSDLPDNPQKMPSKSMVERFDIVLEISATPPVVTAAESDIATKDAECRIISKYEEAFYDAEWSRQVVLLGENSDALETVRAQISEHRAAVLEVITSNSPSK